MKIIVDKPGSGKTAQLISLCAKKGYTLVCASACGIARAKNKAKCLGVTIKNPITVEQFIQGDIHSEITGFCIDDAESVFIALGRGIKIEGITFTSE